MAIYDIYQYFTVLLQYPIGNTTFFIPNLLQFNFKTTQFFPIKRLNIKKKFKINFQYPIQYNQNFR